MTKPFESLGITGEEDIEQLDAILKEKLGVGFADMSFLLGESLHNHAHEVASPFLVMTPHGDYSKLLEDQDKIVEFLRQEATKQENWVPVFVGTSRDPKLPDMIEILFGFKAVDDGDAVIGYVFLNYSGKILHVFVQGDP